MAQVKLTEVPISSTPVSINAIIEDNGSLKRYDLTNYTTKEYVDNSKVVIDTTLQTQGQAADAKAVGDALAEKQPKGNYLTTIPSEYITEAELNAKMAKEIPTKVSELTNDSGFINNDDILDTNGTLKNNVLPEGYPYKEVGEILPETVIQIDPESGQGIILDEFELHIGNAYIVNYNGTEYTCEAKSCLIDNVELPALGNVGVVDESGEIELTNEPFLLIDFPTNIAAAIGVNGFIMPLDGSEELSIAIYGNKINKISNEFLPNIPNLNNIIDGSQIGSVRTIMTSSVIGLAAHAEGFSTTASGYASHAEGFSDNNAFDFITDESTQEEIITAWNDNKFTLASCNYSHAEGNNTLAIADCSHTEGSYTTASGYNSHAEGDSTIASGTSAHAEGNVTTASGYTAHAEGMDTTASGDSSHAEGHSTTASGNRAHAEGYDTEASGISSHAEGHSTTASGDYSHAEGNNTVASGNYSHAEGNNTTAFGDYSHAEGWSFNNAFDYITKESTQEEIITAWDENHFTLANSISSHAEGYHTLALNVSSHAEGYETKAAGNRSHAEGYFTTAAGENSHAEGYETKAVSDYAHAEGHSTTASSDYTHAEGYFTTASGSSSHAEGYHTTASGGSSHAEGYFTTAFSDRSHAEGGNTIASGDYAHAEGNNTTASGQSSHAEGGNTIASGYASHAEGNNTTASGDYSHAEGFSNNNAFAYITKESTDEEIITVWNNNKFTLAFGDSSHVEGKNILALGDSSHAEGYNTVASGDYSHAEGYDTIASGNRAHAEGYSTVASGYASHAEGYDTEASSVYSHAEGINTTASGVNSHAEGHSTIASGEYQHVQGRHNVEDTNNQYAHIVGNGSGSARSNAHTLDWDGNAWFQGDVYVGSTSGINKDEGSKKLVTEEFVNNKGYLTSFTETDPTVPAWAKTATKPTYTAAEVGALAADTLPTAINTALAQAKASGEFDGTSVTVKSVSESTIDGGSNVVTFSDGKTLTVKNGSKGNAYTLTDADKSTIVNAVIAALPVYNGEVI